MANPQVHEEASQHKSNEHGDVIASNGPPQHAEGHPRQSRRKGGISGGEVPALRIVHPGVEEGVPLTFEENFLIPADKPDKVDVIAHPAQNGISEVKGQRVGHENSRGTIIKEYPSGLEFFEEVLHEIIRLINCGEKTMEVFPA